MDSAEMMKLLETRRTYRRFDETRPVPDEAVRDMKAALRLSSCSSNRQLLRFVFVRDPEKVKAVFACTRWAAMLPEGRGTPGEGQRPVMFAALLFEEGKLPRWMLDTDAGIALSNLTLAAWTHGIGSCMLGNIDREGISRILKVPEGMTLHTVTAFGYPAHACHIVPPGPDGSLKYYMDEQGDFYVPKREEDEFIFAEEYGAHR